MATVPAAGPTTSRFRLPPHLPVVGDLEGQFPYLSSSSSSSLQISEEEKIESATDILKEILKPVVDGTEEVSWPPRNPEALISMEKVIARREQEGQLDEGFLSEVNAQLRQSKEDGDKPGLEAMLQKVLQIYATKVLRKRSYAYKGDNVLVAERFLETIIEGASYQRGILTEYVRGIQSRTEEVVKALQGSQQ